MNYVANSFAESNSKKKCENRPRFIKVMTKNSKRLANIWARTV